MSNHTPSSKRQPLPCVLRCMPTRAEIVAFLDDHHRQLTAAAAAAAAAQAAACDAPQRLACFERHRHLFASELECLKREELHEMQSLLEQPTRCGVILLARKEFAARRFFTLQELLPVAVQAFHVKECADALLGRTYQFDPSSTTDYWACHLGMGVRYRIGHADIVRNVEPNICPSAKHDYSSDSDLFAVTPYCPCGATVYPCRTSRYPKLAYSTMPHPTTALDADAQLALASETLRKIELRTKSYMCGVLINDLSYVRKRELACNTRPVASFNREEEIQYHQPAACVKWSVVGLFNVVDRFLDMYHICPDETHFDGKYFDPDRAQKLLVNLNAMLDVVHLLYEEMMQYDVHGHVRYTYLLCRMRALMYVMPIRLKQMAMRIATEMARQMQLQ
jgi:hypothetical protein